MTIYIPSALKGWIEEYKPTEGDLIFVAVTSIFARMYGVKTFLEMHPDDIKSMIWDKPVIHSVNHLNRLSEQGVIDHAKGIDDVATFRLAKKLMVRRPASADSGDAIEYQLKESKSIQTFAYLLGKLADVRVNGTETYIHIIENRYEYAESKMAIQKAKNNVLRRDGTPKRQYIRRKPTEVKERSKLNVIPNIYMKQLETKKQHTDKK